MFWWVSSLSLTVMMGILAVMSGPSSARLQHSMVWLESLTTLLPSGMTQPLLLGMAILLAYLSHRLGRRQRVLSQANILSGQGAVTSRKSFLKLYLLNTALCTAIVIAIVLISMLLALVSHYEAEVRSLNQPMRVTALVTIEGLSDSVYDPSLDTGYRQVSTLTQITPLSHSSEQQMARPWDPLNSPNSKSARAKNPPSNETLKVLLSAYSYNVGPANAKANDPLTVVNTLLPKQQVWMTLALSPIATDSEAIKNTVAASGFDSQRWLRTRHIDATAKILTVMTPENEVVSQGHPTLAVGEQTLRWRLRQQFLQDWSQLSAAQQQSRAVTLSLLTGDRALITRDTKSLYQLAGISHLLAISGTHVLFLAIMLAALVMAIVTRTAPSLYAWWPRWQLRWVVMVITAFIYAAFTGFDVPAARTAWMLVAIGLVRVSLVPVRPLKVLLALAVLMVWVDPFVLWQVGYWLSFIAVALLMLYEQGQETGDKQPIIDTDVPPLLRVRRWLLPRSWQVIKLQFWIFIALLPLTLLLFGKVSLWGLVINLFAIGLYGMAIVPLNLLAGVCYLLFPALAVVLWQVAITIVALTHRTIEVIVGWQVVSRQHEAWLYTPVNLGTLIIVSLALLPWLLPKGMLSRWLALPPLSLLILTMLPAQADEGESAPIVYLLPTTERYLQVVLIKDNAQQTHWLLLADYRNAKQLNYMTLEVARVSERLHQQLGTLGVRSLQGIVVQTPTAFSDTKTSANKLSNTKPPTLATVATTLAAQLPTSQLWLAGEPTISPSTVPTLTDTDTESTIPPMVTCKSGQRWQTEGVTFSLETITGWPEVQRASVAGCVIVLQSQQPIKVYKFSAANPLAPALIATTGADSLVNKEEGYDKKVSQDNSSMEPLPEPKHQLIIDAASHAQLWPLRQLLCPKSDIVNAAVNTTTNTILLTHSDSQIDERSRQKLDARASINNFGQLIVINKATDNPLINTER